MADPNIVIGAAGWSIPSRLKHFFGEEGAHLHRYSRRLNGVEINSSFYRDHKHETYVKWASMVPDNFRFSVKLSRYFTQTMRLKESGAKLEEVLHGISGLESKWGFLLVQLPPSLGFNLKTAALFIQKLRNHYKGPLAWEPRHATWGTDEAMGLLHDYGIIKVEADPEPCPIIGSARRKGPRYLRLHGSPETYKSRYPMDAIEAVARSLGGEKAWCIFDNTTFGFAIENALELKNFYLK